MMNINFYVKSMGSFIILSVMWYERMTKCYLLHTDPLEFSELGKTCQVICFPLSTLNHRNFIEHLGPPNHDSQNSPDETHEPKMRCYAMSSNYGHWWGYIAMSFGPWASASFCEYELFWALKEIFPKSMLALTWCGLPMKWSHVVWKICPQHLVELV